MKVDEIVAFVKKNKKLININRNVKRKNNPKGYKFYKEKVKTLILGLGNMGMHDYNSKKNISRKLFKKLGKKFDIIGGVDKDIKKLNLFKKKFKKPIFKNLKESFTNTNPDLIIISTSTRT